MNTIELLQEMKSCITEGEKPIKAGTIMRLKRTYLQWHYFTDGINTMIIMGYDSKDWGKVKILK